MKHIKQYENIKNIIYDPKDTRRWYWLLPTDDRFEKSLRDIGCTSTWFLDSERIKKNKYIFVSYINADWGWNVYKGKLTDDFYESMGCKFKGTVNILGHDPELEDPINKYNL